MGGKRGDSRQGKRLVCARTLNPATLMNLRAPLGEGYQNDHEGGQKYLIFDKKGAL